MLELIKKYFIFSIIKLSLWLKVLFESLIQPLNFVVVFQIDKISLTLSFVIYNFLAIKFGLFLVCFISINLKSYLNNC